MAMAVALLGVISPFSGDARTPTRLDPLSLRPRGPRVRLGEYHDAWAFSPDGSQLALGMGGAGRVCGRGICVVDVGDMAVRGDVDAPIAVEALAWVRPRRIVAVLQSGGIIVADPATGAIVRRTPLPYTTRYGAWAQTRAGVAVLMGSRRLRLVVAGASGAVRTARLRRMRRAVTGSPGLAVDPRGRRAFVVAAGAPVTEVDLRTMRVRYHRVGLPRPRRGPAAIRSRDALWLEKGLVAVSGYDSRGAPAGVHVVDTKTWTARTVDRRAGQAEITAGRLLVYSSDAFTPRARRVGLRIYTRDGSRLISHLFANQTLDVEVADARAYAYRIGGRRRALHVVDARSGRIVRTTRPPPREHDLDILGH